MESRVFIGADKDLLHSAYRIRRIMVHTGAISYTHDDAQLYKQQLEGIAGLKRLPEGGYITYAYKELGFDCILFYGTTYWGNQTKEYIPQYTIYCKVDFVKMCGYGTVNRIRSTDMLEEIHQKFQTAMEQINPKLPNFSEWIVKRIDYSMDLTVESPELYIQLLQKGAAMPRFYKKLYDLKSHRRKHLSGSVYYKCKSKTVNFYNKYDQLSKKAEPPEDLEETRHIIRLELQILKPSTDFRTTYGIIHNRLPYYLKPLISVRLLKDTYKQIAVNSGDYYTLDEAKARIDASDKDEKTKETLKQFLSEVAVCKSVEGYHTKHPRHAIHKLAKELETLGINPVCITQRQQRQYHIKKLPSLYERIAADVEKRLQPIPEQVQSEKERMIEEIKRELLQK